METLTTYKFYNTKLERLAIFAEEVETKGEKYLNLVVIPCNAQDQFSRKKAKELYENAKAFLPVKGISFGSIPVKDNKPKFTFLAFCKAHFLRQREKIFDLGESVIVSEIATINSKKIFGTDKLHVK